MIVRRPGWTAGRGELRLFPALLIESRPEKMPRQLRAILRNDENPHCRRRAQVTPASSGAAIARQRPTVAIGVVPDEPVHIIGCWMFGEVRREVAALVDGTPPRYAARASALADEYRSHDAVTRALEIIETAARTGRVPQSDATAA